jgi:ectoine hydroxylase-related dioxygenase (phytanoyl-CoA dioxygenase family)
MSLATKMSLDAPAFEESGALVIRGAFDSRWVNQMREVVERTLAVLREDRSAAQFDTSVDIALRDPQAMEFVLNSPGASIAKSVMRSRTARFYGDQMFVKEPGVATTTPWHNDQPYWPVSGSKVCSIWLALDVVTKASSGLEYVRGSHRWGRFFRPDGFTEKGKQLFAAAEGESMPDFDQRRDEFEFLSWDMEPGDCLVHHGLTVHGASDNATRQPRRRAYSTRWTGDDARYMTPRPYMASNLIDTSLVDGGPLESAKFPLVIDA